MLAALNNKDDHKDDHRDVYEKIFEKLVKEKFDTIKELTYGINNDSSTYYFKNNTAKKDLVISIIL